MPRFLLLLSSTAIGLASLACAHATNLLPSSQGGYEHRAILVDTFVDGHGDWWTNCDKGGSYEVLNGKLRLTIPNEMGTSVAGHPALDYLSPPYILDLVIRHTQGSRADYFAVGFRFSDNKNVATLHVNGYGQIALGVMQDGEYLEIIPWSRSYQSLDGGIHVQLEDQGDRLSVSLGNEPVLSMPFEYLKAGGAYFFVGAYDAAGSTWEVDEVAAWASPG